MKTLVTRIVRKGKSALNDIRHGGYTGGIHKTPFAHLGAHHTVSTNHALIPILLEPVLTKGDVFVDVGCGRGRVLNWVVDDGRASAVFGIELDKRFAAEVARRFLNNHSVTVVAGDALSSLPDSGTVFYLWNPFDSDVMERFKETLISKYRALGTLSRVRVVYHHCLHADVWTTDARCCATPVSLPAGVAEEAILITFPGANPASAMP